MVDNTTSPLEERQDVNIDFVEEEQKKGLGVHFDLPLARFQMAKWVLICLFGLMVFLIMWRIAPDTKPKDDIKAVFDKVFDSVVPIASLILGYYFGSSTQKND